MSDQGFMNMGCSLLTTEAALRPGEERFSAVMKHSGIGMAIAAPDGHWLEVNPAFCAIVGYPEEELLATTFQSITHPDDLNADLEFVRRMLRREIETFEIEKRYLHKQGHFIWIQLNVSLVWRADGQPDYFIGQIQDITQRKRAEDQIREQARLLDLVPDAILVRDLDDCIRFWNKSAARIYGWTAVEAVGKKTADLLYRTVSNASKYQEGRKMVLEKGEWQAESGIRTKDGQEAFIETRWILVRDSDGNPQSILDISTDVTEKKKFEAQFLRSQRMEGIGSLVGGIAHDLNNMLTPLMVAVQVLQEKIRDEDGRKLLQALETNVQRGAALVKQVLAFGRGVAGERIAVNPKHIAREIKQIIHETFPKSVEFELQSPPELWAINGDPTQLHQVLLNLCLNARDAMPEGGRLSIHMDNVRFDETYAGMNPEAKPGPYVCLKVTDTGTGIPREIQDKIFDPFFTTKEPGKGTGLGLATTMTIVKGHGGFIHCHSAAGKGSIFEVYLPANMAPAGEEALPRDPYRLPHGNNELVLVVDDEESIRNLVLKMLEKFGYRVLLAVDGIEALSLYASRQQDIAVVITDIVMPKMDGPAAVVALRAMNPKIKIIGSSGMASDGSVTRAFHAGIQHFVPKPYTAEIMLHTLHSVLQGNFAN